MKDDNCKAAGEQISRLQELFGKDVMDSGISKKQADWLEANPGLLSKSITALMKKFSKNAAALEDHKENWKNFYDKHFNLRVDFSKLAIPMFCELHACTSIIVAEGVGIDDANAAMHKKFKVGYEAKNFDALVADNDRSSGETYMVIVPPDYLFIDNENCPERVGITLLERILLEMGRNHNPEHLDYSPHSSVCYGSRFENGKSPSFCFHVGGYSGSRHFRIFEQGGSFEYSQNQYGFSVMLCS